MKQGDTKKPKVFTGGRWGPLAGFGLAWSVHGQALALGVCAAYLLTSPYEAPHLFALLWVQTELFMSSSVHPRVRKSNFLSPDKIPSLASLFVLADAQPPP